MKDIITALQADPGDPDKVHLFIDGKHLMSVTVDVAAAEKLTVGQECPPSRVERLHHAQELQQAYESAIRFLSYRPRSEREVELRMRKKGFQPEQISPVMDRLRDRGFINDLEFARFWVGNRMAFSPRGPRLLKSELRQKGVPAEVVDAALQERTDAQEEAEQEAVELEDAWDNSGSDEPVAGSDLANALTLAHKKMRTYSKLDPQTFKRRMSGFLMRRGYNYDTVGAVLRRIGSADDGETETAGD